MIDAVLARYAALLGHADVAHDPAERMRLDWLLAVALDGLERVTAHHQARGGSWLDQRMAQSRKVVEIAAGFVVDGRGVWARDMAAALVAELAEADTDTTAAWVRPAVDAAATWLREAKDRNLSVDLRAWEAAVDAAYSAQPPAAIEAAAAEVLGHGGRHRARELAVDAMALASGWLVAQAAHRRREARRGA